MDTKIKGRPYSFFGAIALLVAFVLVGVCARIWELMQPTLCIQAQVSSIEWNHSHNDLHWPTERISVHVVGDERPVDFPVSDWIPSIHDGDVVLFVARRRFPWPGSSRSLEGLKVYEISDLKGISKKLACELQVEEKAGPSTMGR